MSDIDKQRNRLISRSQRKKEAAAKISVRKPELGQLLNDSTPDTIRVRNLRPKTRRVMSVQAFAVTMACLIALVSLALYVGYRVHTSSPEYQMRTALEYIARADIGIVQVDDVINSEITIDTAQQVVTAQSGIDAAKQSLSKANDILIAVYDKASAQERRRIALLQEAIVARGQLLSLAPPLLQVTESSAQALVEAAQGWEDLKKATDVSAQAVDSIQSQTKASVKKSVKQNVEAIEHLRTAVSRFKVAQKRFDEVDFSSYIDYFNVRLKMSSALQKAGQSWLAGDAGKFMGYVQTYNGLSVQAEKMEKKTLKLPSEVIAKAYQDIVGTINKEYFAIRTKVLQVDSMVR